MAPSEAELDDGIVFGVGALNHDEVRPRLDIDVMIARQPDVFNLFLLALIELKADRSKLGYFQLAGIHGLPSTLWDGVGKDFPDDTGGYCAHGRLIFPTWHRPYLALLEQELFRNMMRIVREYDRPFQSRYLTAAKAFRLPYWDYFRPRDVDVRFPGIKLEGHRTSYDYDFRMPDILNVREVAIRMPPDDHLEVRANPLYSFKFTDKLNLDRDWAKADLKGFNPNRTVRRPRDKNSKYHNVEQLSDVLNSGREGRCSIMLDILNPNSNRYFEYGDIASDAVLRKGDMTASSGKAGSYSSIEGLHGDFHTLIGGPNGHMSHPSIAAFDPVFWLHHCNVDRIFAIWQAVHPKAWFPPPGRDSRGGHLKPENEKPLLPFYKYFTDRGQPIYYDSDWARKTEKFGYTYPDLDGLSDPRTIWSNVYRKYIWSIRTASSSRFSSPPSDMTPLNLNRAQVFRYPDRSPRPSSVEPDHPSARVVYHRVSSSGSDNLSTSRIVYKRVTSSESDTLLTERRAAYLSLNDDEYIPAPDNDIDPSFDREWYIDNIVKRNTLNGPFTVYFFLSPKHLFSTFDSPSTYATNPYLAGINHIFAAPRQVCDNCGQQDAAGVLASGTIPITPLLLDYMHNGVLESMRPDDVHGFLVRFLRWRVVYGGSLISDPRDMPNFEVSVVAKKTREDGSTVWYSYPDIVEDIIYNSD